MNLGIGLAPTTSLVLLSGFSALAVIACDPSLSPASESGVGARDVCDNTPAPGWVLRDKDGQRVQALVEPRCGQSSNLTVMNRCRPLDFGASSNFPCVRVIDHDGRYINILYELSTGLIEPCQGGYGSDIDAKWKEAGNLSPRYLGADCAGDPYGDLDRSKYSPEQLRARAVYRAEGNLWYPSESSCFERDTPVWTWDPGSHTCQANGASSSALCVFRPTPDWIHTLLPNPPYTMAVEYE